VIETMQARLKRMPDAMRVRRRTVEHVFGTIKDWMGRSHFKTRTLEKVGTEMSLHVLAYNMKRGINMLGVPKMIAAARLSPRTQRAPAISKQTTRFHSVSVGSGRLLWARSANHAGSLRLQVQVALIEVANEP
jgi:hypothetical protein